MSTGKQSDSDRAMARLLADALRQPEGAAVGSACPDAEVLAAYAERHLDAAETERWETHFAECGRCQKILAVLTDRGEEPLSEAELERFGRKVAAVEVGAPVTLRSERIKKVISFERPRTAWAWLASAMGVAAAAALWVALRPVPRTASVAITAQKSASEPAAPSSESLEARANVPAPPATGEREAEQEQKAPAEFAPALKKETAPAGRQAPSAQLQAPAPPVTEARRDSQTESAAQAQTQTVLQAANRPAQEQARAKQSDDVTTPAAAPPPAAPAVAPPAAAPEAASAAAAPAPLPTASPDASARAVAPLSATPVNAGQASSEANAAPQAKTAPNRTVQSFASRQALGALAANPPGRLVTVASPSGNVLWRMGQRGEIQRSMDRGQSWQSQASNVTSDLVSGAAASDNVAWILGRAGVILRTSDGERWQRILSPDPSADWIAVQVTDAQHAVITSMDQRRFATEDGGQTWKQE